MNRPVFRGFSTQKTTMMRNQKKKKRSAGSTSRFSMSTNIRSTREAGFIHPPDRRGDWNGLST